MHDLKNINWSKGILVVGGSLLLDISASLAANTSLKGLLIHAGVVFCATAGAFIMDAAKKID